MERLIFHVSVFYGRGVEVGVAAALVGGGVLEGFGVLEGAEVLVGRMPGVAV